MNLHYRVDGGDLKKHNAKDEKKYGKVSGRVVDKGDVSRGKKGPGIDMGRRHKAKHRVDD